MSYQIMVFNSNHNYLFEVLSELQSSIRKLLIDQYVESENCSHHFGDCDYSSGPQLNPCMPCHRLWLKPAHQLRKRRYYYQFWEST